MEPRVRTQVRTQVHTAACAPRRREGESISDRNDTRTERGEYVGALRPLWCVDHIMWSHHSRMGAPLLQVGRHLRLMMVLTMGEGFPQAFASVDG